MERDLRRRCHDALKLFLPKLLVIYLHYPSIRAQHVVILFEKPARPYREIGLVSSLGGWFASDGDNYHKMQMAAAQLGADAVIVQGAQPQSQRDYWQYPKTSGIAIKYTD